MSSRKVLFLAAIAFAVVAVGFLLVSVLGDGPKPRTAKDRGDDDTETHAGGGGGGSYSTGDDDDDHVPVDPAELLPVSGTVRDTGGSPVPGVVVTFSGDDGDDSATTGPGGQYRLEVPPGHYRARAIGDDLVGAATEVLDLKHGSAGGSVDLVVGRLATVSGRVKDSRGTPVPDATVTFETLLRGGRVRSQDLDDRGSAQSAGDGAYTIKVAPGPVRVTAERGGLKARTFLDNVESGSSRTADLTFPLGAEIAGRVVGPDRRPVPGARLVAVTTGDSIEAATDDRGGFAINVPVGKLTLQASAPGLAPAPPQILAVTEEGITGIEVVLQAGRTISGKVFDPDGSPVEGASVAARGRMPVAAREVTTGADGTFEIAGLTDGPFELTAKKAPFAAGHLAGVQPPAQGLELTLQRTGAIVGIVKGGDGQPITDYTVKVDHYMDGGRRVSGSGNATRRLAPDGRFELRGLHPGEYELVFAAPGLATARKSGIKIDQMEVADLEVILERGGTIEGKVFDAVNGTPLGGARVVAEQGRSGGTAVSAGDGHFTIKDLAPGSKQIIVSRPGYVGRTIGAIEIRAGGSTPVEVRLSPGDSNMKGAMPMEVSGIGAVLGMEGGALVISRIEPGSPAEREGLAPGDRITSIDGKPSNSLDASAAAGAIRGPAGTRVSIGISRGGGAFTRTIQRANVRINPERP